MSMQRPINDPIPESIPWMWFVLLGAIFTVLGFVGLGMAFTLTVFVVLYYAILLLIGGASQVISSFFSPRWSELFLHLAAGVLYLLGGFYLLNYPLRGAGIIILFMAFTFILSGISRMILAFLHRRFLSWLAVFLGGVISTMLGIFILSEWPEDLWVIGLFFAIDLIMQGVSWIALGFQLRSAIAAGNLPG